MIWLIINLAFLILAGTLIVSISEWFGKKWLPQSSDSYQNLFANQAVYLYSRKKLIVVLALHALIGLVVFGTIYLIYYSNRNIIIFNNEITSKEQMSFLYISMWTIGVLVSVFLLNIFISYFRKAHILANYDRDYYKNWEEKKYVYLPKDSFSLSKFKLSEKGVLDLKKLINNLDEKIIKINKLERSFLSKDQYFLMCSTLDEIADFLSSEDLRTGTQLNELTDSIFRNIYTKIYNYKKIHSLTFS